MLTFADWSDPLPGYVEGDLVAHSGESAAGSFVQTLVLTDIASGWTECVALIAREQTLIAEALLKMRAALPFTARTRNRQRQQRFHERDDYRLLC